jgi:hypothetical protein
MAFPRIVVRDREVILLSGFDEKSEDRSRASRSVDVHAEGELVQSTKLHPDAVAFGFVEGRWIASA